MIKKGFKRAISLISAAAMALTLGACDLGKGKADLTIFGKKSDMEKSYMQKVFELYRESTGKTLDVIMIEDAKFEDEAEKRLSNGNTPDIFMHFHNSDLNRFDVDGNFMYLNDQPWAGELTDSARTYCTDDDGNLLGLPFWESSVSGCYYNKTILDSLGLKPAATQAEFDTLCQALADIGYTPICWPADGCSWMMQFGLDPIFADDPENLRKINSNETTYAEIPEVTQMVRWVSDAAEKGWFGTNYMDIGWDGISPTLANGDAVMTFIWDTWFYTDFTAGKYSVDDFSVMPVFMDTVEEGTYEGGNLNMMMVNKNSEHLDEALDFLEFCASPENYNAAFDGIATVSCFKGMNTNIQSKMVMDNSASISERERVSTASSRIVGYAAEDVAELYNKMFRKQLSVSECVEQMDKKRIERAKAEGMEGF